MSGDKEIDDEMLAGDDVLDEDYEDSEGGDEDLGDEDWDSYDEEAGEGEDAAPAKKTAKSKKFDKMIIGGAVLLGLGFLGFKMMGSAPPAGPAPMAQQANSAAEDAARRKLTTASLQDSTPTAQRSVVYGLNRDDKQAANEDKPAEGLLENPEALKKFQQTASERADAEREITGGELPPAFDSGDLPLPAETPEIVEAEPPMPVPMASGTPDSVLTPLPPEAPAPELTAPEAPVVASAVADEPVADTPAIEAPAADLPVPHAPDAPPESMGLPRATDFARATPAPETAEKPAQNPPATASVPAEEVQALQNQVQEMAAEMRGLRAQVQRIGELESTIEQLERALETRGSAAPAPRAAAAEERPAPRRAQAQATARTASVRWVLRSAQPGQAMVARQGDSEMRSVAVGDTLSGIGRVTQIYRGGNGWIVEGTAGRIEQ